MHACNAEILASSADPLPRGLGTKPLSLSASSSCSTATFKPSEEAAPAAQQKHTSGFPGTFLAILEAKGHLLAGPQNNFPGLRRAAKASAITHPGGAPIQTQGMHSHQLNGLSLCRSRQAAYITACSGEPSWQRPHCTSRWSVHAQLHTSRAVAAQALTQTPRSKLPCIREPMGLYEAASRGLAHTQTPYLITPGKSVRAAKHLASLARSAATPAGVPAAPTPLEYLIPGVSKGLQSGAHHLWGRAWSHTSQVLRRGSWFT